MARGFGGVRHTSLPLNASEHLLRASTHTLLVTDAVDRSKNDMPCAPRGTEYDPRQHSASSLRAS